MSDQPDEPKQAQKSQGQLSASNTSNTSNASDTSRTGAANAATPAPKLNERGVVVEGLRLTSVMNDAPRAFLARAPLVLLPAADHPWQEYRRVLEHFARERRVFALDWPGFGASEKPTPTEFAYDGQRYTAILAGWLDGLGIGRAVLLGNGIGATVAIRYAAEHDRRVLGLVLVAPLGFGQAGLGRRVVGAALAKERVRRRAGGLLTSLALGPDNDETRAIQAARTSRRGTPEEAAANAAAAALAGNAARSYEALATLSREVKAPTLVIRGALDPVVSAADAQQATQLVGPHGALEVLLPEAGHLPFLQQPARFLSAVDGLLSTAEMAAIEGR